MEKINVSELILDYTLYPRREVDSQHVGYMIESIKAGIELPPVIADYKSKKVVDGFHRIAALTRFDKEKSTISTILKKYNSDAEIFIDAMKYNSGHGRTLTQYDRTHCIIRGEQLHIPKDVIADALKMTVVKLGKLTTGRVGTLKTAVSSKSSRRIPLKRTISHKANEILTEEQELANIKLSGMNQAFYVNQIILLIDSGLLDTNDKKLMERVAVLKEKLSSF